MHAPTSSIAAPTPKTGRQLRPDESIQPVSRLHRMPGSVPSVFAMPSSTLAWRGATSRMLVQQPACVRAPKAMLAAHLRFV